MTLREIERQAWAAGLDVNVTWWWDDDGGNMVLTACVFRMLTFTRKYTIECPRTEWCGKRRDYVTRKNLKEIQQSMYREMRDILLGHAAQALREEE